MNDAGVEFLRTKEARGVRARMRSQRKHSDVESIVEEDTYRWTCLATVSSVRVGADVRDTAQRTTAKIIELMGHGIENDGEEWREPAKVGLGEEIARISPAYPQVPRREV